MVSARASRVGLAAILGASAALRFIACCRGGQYFFGDEERYDRSVRLYLALAHGDWRAARAVLAMPEHALFAWVGAAATAIQHLLAQATVFGDWGRHPEGILFTVGLGACVLSLFSTANILLVYRLARSLGGDREEALWAALLMAASNTSFYFSRHLLPYDCAIFAGLLALAVGLRAPVSWRAAASGALAACACLLYNGYWFLPPALASSLLVAWRRQPGRLRLSGLWAAGFALGLGIPLMAGTLAGCSGYWATMAAFGRSATQGLFSEGWSLPWAYLWESEGPIGAAAAACVILAVGSELGRGRTPGARLLAWFAALAVGYGLLALSSSGLGLFVVYGRSVKPLVPFLCLAAGWALRLLISGRGWLRAAAAAALAVSGALHIESHLGRVFPREFEISVLRAWGNPKRTLSVSGSLYVPVAMAVERPDLALVNAQFLYPIRGYIGFPPGETILTAENPLSYRPYQYEGFTPRERAILRSNDVSMRLIRLAEPAGVPDDLPVSQRFNPTEKPTGRR
jgi:hypothetical protein